MLFTSGNTHSLCPLDFAQKCCQNAGIMPFQRPKFQKCSGGHGPGPPPLDGRALRRVCMYKTDRFHFPVQLLMHRGRHTVVRTSVTHSPRRLEAIFWFLPRCDVIGAPITEQTTAKWNLFVKRNLWRCRVNTKSGTFFAAL